MRKQVIMIALALLAGASLHTEAAAKKEKQQQHACCTQLVTDTDSLSYSAGYVLANIVKNQYLMGLAHQLEGTPDSLDMQTAYRGLYDALMNDTTRFNPQTAEAYLKERFEAGQKVKEEHQIAAGKQFLEENARKEGVVVLPSGLQYKVLTEGNGPVAKASDRVKVKYEGRLTDGTVFDSTERHGGEPAVFRPDGVIKGWTEALTMMPVGSKWQLYIPYDLAYGAQGAGPIPPYSTLVFDVEVVGIEETE